MKNKRLKWNRGDAGDVWAEGAETRYFIRKHAREYYTLKQAGRPGGEMFNRVRDAKAAAEAREEVR